MGKNKDKNTPLSINKIFNKINLNDAPSFFRINTYITSLLVLVVILICIPGALETIENIFISIGNIFIRIFTDKDLIQRIDLSNSKTQLIAIGSVLAEGLLCLIICLISSKIINHKKEH